MNQQELYLQFGRQVRHLRHLRHLTQSQLAEISNLSVEFISLVERGRTAPSLKNIVGLSEALQVPLCAFFLFASAKEYLPDYWQACAANERQYYIPRMGKMKVLIVDDNSAFRESAADFLSEIEWLEVAATAESAEAARVALDDYKPDIILLDIGMPGLNGLDFAIEIRQRWPRIRVIFLTALDSPTYRKKSLAVGAHGFVKKTEMMERLVPLLESLN